MRSDPGECVRHSHATPHGVLSNPTPSPLQAAHHIPFRLAAVTPCLHTRPDSQNDALLRTGENGATFDSSVDWTANRSKIDSIRAIGELLEHSPPCPALALRHRRHGQALRPTHRHQPGEPFSGCSAPPVESSLKRGG